MPTRVPSHHFSWTGCRAKTVSWLWDAIPALGNPFNSVLDLMAACEMRFMQRSAVLAALVENRAILDHSVAIVLNKSEHSNRLLRTDNEKRK
jgi:hypothetical protein